MVNGVQYLRSLNRPSRSCNLMSPDYFLWRYVKYMLYAVEATTLEAMKVNISRAINTIRPKLIFTFSSYEKILILCDQTCSNVSTVLTT